MKIKNITKNIIAVFVSASMLMSCNLDLVPTDAIIYDDQDENALAMQSMNDIVKFYHGVLASYRSLCSGTIDMTTDVMVDYFNATKSYGNNYGPVHRLDDSYTPADDYVESIWAGHYGAIKNYNVAIEQAERIEDEELKPAASYLQSIAYFCRASAYLTLTRLWGNAYDAATASTDRSVPLVLEYDINYVPERNTVEEIYMQIFDDLKFAEDLVQYEYDMYGLVFQPITIDAVNALWARYYLDTKNYIKAFEYAQKVINSQTAYNGEGYKLAKTAAEMEAEYIADSYYEPVVQLYADLSEGSVSHSIYTLVGFDDNEGKYFGPYYLPSKTLLNKYEPTDLRLTSWFSQSMYPLFIQGSFHDGVYTFIKFLGNPSLYSGDIESSNNCAKPIMISEMYLIAAEAAYMKDNASNINSTKYLNELQSARGASKTDGTLQNIKEEWYKELVGNGHRFVCLKRWGDGIPKREVQDDAVNFVESGYVFDQREIEAGSHLFNFPIPSYELKITPELGQNDGYSAK